MIAVSLIAVRLIAVRLNVVLLTSASRRLRWPRGASRTEAPACRGMRFPDAAENQVNAYQNKQRKVKRQEAGQLRVMKCQEAGQLRVMKCQEAGGQRVMKCQEACWPGAEAAKGALVAPPLLPRCPPSAPRHELVLPASLDGGGGDPGTLRDTLAGFGPGHCRARWDGRAHLPGGCWRSADASRPCVVCGRPGGWATRGRRASSRRCGHGEVP